MASDITPEVQRLHMTEVYGPKFVEKTEKAHEKAMTLRHHGENGKSAAAATAESNQPAGGFDDTPFARVPPGYTLKFTFHRASNLPAADFNSLSSDPYVLAELKTDLPKRHKQDPNITFRTPTVRKNVNPEWNAEWIVANVPASGFHLKCRVFDEDPADHDDRLGNAHVVVEGISEDWQGIKETSYHLKKRAGSKRAYMVRTVVATCSAFSRDLDADIFISVECLGRTPAVNGLPIYTLGPVYWFKHFSPLIGRLLGLSDSGEHEKGKTSSYK
jgi:C2 domain